MLCVVLSNRLLSSALDVRLFGRASCAENVVDSLVAFVTLVLLDRLGVVPRQRHGERPWPRPRGWIVHRDRPVDQARRRRRKALDDAKRRGIRVAIRASLLEVRGLDDERVALPVASRVAHVEVNIRSGMWSAVETDDPGIGNHLIRNWRESLPR